MKYNENIEYPELPHIFVTCLDHSRLKRAISKIDDLMGTDEYDEDWANMRHYLYILQQRIEEAEPIIINNLNKI